MVRRHTPSIWRCRLKPADAIPWTDANQRHLVAALARVRADLERHDGREEMGTIRARTPEPPALISPGAAPPALDVLATTFDLSPFERAVVLLCAGIELDAAFADLCAAARGDPARASPTFGLALAALESPHWSALTPAAPLRHWRLIEVVQQPGTPLTASPLRIDERI